MRRASALKKIIIQTTPAQKLNWAKKHWRLYALLLIPVAYIIIFRYVPMYGVTIAFKEYRIREGMLRSPWADPWFKYFKTFMSTYLFGRLLKNTFLLSIYATAAGFIPPIFLALMLNECRSAKYKKMVQLITYAPHFISTVIMVGILMQILSLYGTVNNFMALMGLERFSFLGKPQLFRHIYVWSGVWQTAGWSAIIYLAALASINPELYEAATIDGATIWQRMWHIDLPGIAATAIILLILALARVLNVGFEKVYLLQNPLNLDQSEILATYVYKVGLRNMQYSYSTAVGFFQSVVSLVLIVIVNSIAKRVSETSLW